VFVVVIVGVLFSSCASTHMAMREPNSRVEFKKEDFNFSQQITGTATSTRILGIDWSRLFNSENASVSGSTGMLGLANIPVVGGFVSNPTQGYALYDIMSNNKGYDVVFYPQFVTKEKKPIGIGFLYKIVTVEATAKLGKIKE